MHCGPVTACTCAQDLQPLRLGARQSQPSPLHTTNLTPTPVCDPQQELDRDDHLPTQPPSPFAAVAAAAAATAAATAATAAATQISGASYRPLAFPTPVHTISDYDTFARDHTLPQQYSPTPYHHHHHQPQQHCYHLDQTNQPATHADPPHPHLHLSQAHNPKTNLPEPNDIASAHRSASDKDSTPAGWKSMNTKPPFLHTEEDERDRHRFASLRPDLVFGDYQLGKTLGVGASGKVKFAIHIPTGKPVAIKIIRKSLLEHKPAIAAKIRREIAVLKLLAGAAAQRNCTNNVGVLALFDVYETEKCILLILEYCPGGDLFDVVLSCGYLCNDDALNAFQQLVYALYFCHRQGIAHRDLKLENVLIDANGRLKLADFGMASIMSPGSLLETACGSPNYCAPEVLSGGLYDGARSDIWSLGIILYTIVTGGLPFDDENFSRLLSKIQAGLFHMPEEVEPQVASLIHGMLRVNPEERISLTEIMNSPWFQSRPPSSPASDSARASRVAAACYSSLDVYQGRMRTVFAEPIKEPNMGYLMHLTHLGLGDTPTILRRLRSNRGCVEKEFYTRIASFVRESFVTTHISNEVPSSPKVAFVSSSLDSTNDMNDAMLAEDALPGCPSLEGTELLLPPSMTRTEFKL